MFCLLGLCLLVGGECVSLLLHGGDTGGGLRDLTFRFLSGGDLEDGFLGLVGSSELGDSGSLSRGDLTGR